MMQHEADAPERCLLWARRAAAEIMNLHLYNDDPAPIRFQKIAGVIAAAMNHAHREEREALLEVTEN